MHMTISQFLEMVSDNPLCLCMLLLDVWPLSVLSAVVLHDRLPDYHLMINTIGVKPMYIQVYHSWSNADH